MSKDIPEFYRSILEASDRGELWGISSEQSHWTQLEFDFILVNDEFEQTVIKLNEIITSPRAGLHKKTSLHDDFISELMAQRE